MTSSGEDLPFKQVPTLKSAVVELLALPDNLVQLAKDNENTVGLILFIDL